MNMNMGDGKWKKNRKNLSQVVQRADENSIQNKKLRCKKKYGKRKEV